ncbi:DUF4336 domain-containing protein [Paraburkholderia sediminicola]|uniref:DUF4336 domain-containing protein n=1 Tax=Paraburkholderia sediminicola TaxID=458836 RepID=UPI0038BA895D
MPQLEKIAENIWITSTSHAFLGLRVGTRMTVARLAGGGLWLHSPVTMTAEVRNELDAIGPVNHIVCPNLYHHVYAGEAVAAYPRAMLHGPHALRRKRKDLPFAADLSDTPHPDWASDLIPLTIRGCKLAETVFFHVSTRTLITSDLVENFDSSPHWLTRTYLKLSGLQGNITWSPPLRFLYSDRKLARESIDHILEWPFERVVIAHGNIILENARESVERGFVWLQAP